MTTFKLDETPDDLVMEIPAGKELRCPHFNDKIGKICNKMFCRGEASTKPQEFKCPNCGKFTIFQLI